MDDPTDRILELSRFWFQRVLVPLMVCVGIAGNTITVMVMTRRRMRSSTNIYLTALAIADIIYLFFVLVLSFKHYNNVHDPKYALYWRFYGLSHWICDAASSTSVWLTVCFTVERYIAVCHPMRGKVLCTENRAKSVTVIVYLFCILTTASTTFEYQLSLTKSDECKCNDTQPSNTTNNVQPLPNNVSLTKDQRHIVRGDSKVYNNPELREALENILAKCTDYQAHTIYIYPRNSTKTTSNDTTTVGNVTIMHKVVSDPLNKSLEVADNTSSSLDKCCESDLRIDVEPTNLGKNDTYNSFMSWYSALIWGIIPLILIALFNCCLIEAVYVSQQKRKTMSRSNTQNSQSESTSSVTNENRITIMLIAVVGMFLFCQTPTASHLIYYNFYPPTTNYEINIYKILGNIFNSLLAINASCNFLLYSIISKKFRSTFKQLFFEFGKKKKQDILQLSSLKSQNTSKFNPAYHGICRNSSEYRTPRNLETTSLTSIIPRSKSLGAKPMGKSRSRELGLGPTNL